MAFLFSLSVLVVLVLSSLQQGYAASSCPCDDPSLCEPIKGSPKNEIFGFMISQDNWPKYNWSLLTTVALFTTFNTSLLCHAHSKGVRVVLSASYPINELQNLTNVEVWIQKQLAAVQTNFADGLNIDIEGATENGTNQSTLLLQLVQNTTLAFKTANKDYQVTFDVAWSPNCIDGRCYDYSGIADATDFVVIMSYDERSQIFGTCLASANSALSTTAEGVEDYLKLGIPLNKLVLGLPWYGYDYPCLSLTEDSLCTIPKVPFRGVNCSDAAGTQRSYSDIRDLIRTSTTFIQWNDKLQSPFFNYKTSGGEQHQVWFDNTESLSLKYAFAAQVGLHGLAVWNIDSVNYGDSPDQKFLREEMWEAITIFFSA